MQKYRVYELAKMFNKSNDEIISILQKNNIQVNNSLNSVDDKARDVVEKEIAPKKTKRPMIRTVRFDRQGRPENRKEQTQGKSKFYTSYTPEQAKKPKEAQAGVQTTKSGDTRPVKETQKREGTPVRGERKEGTSQRDNREKGVRNDRRNTGERSGRNDRNNRNAGSPSSDRRRQDGSGRPGQNRTDDRSSVSNRNRQGVRSTGNDKRKEGSGVRGKTTPNRKPTVTTDSVPVATAPRREKSARKTTKKDYQQHRREKESGSLMARSLSQGRKKKHSLDKKTTTYPTEVEVPSSVTVKELAELFGREVSEVIKQLMLNGVMATINQNLDEDTVGVLAEEFGVTLLEAEVPEDPTDYTPEEDDPSDLVERPPVVTIMGHVDHGKTTLLDALRSTHVAQQEAGGITQGIGAYQIHYKKHKITFLDTPGHEAFTAMRSRGAQVTDIAVLIVAADDGVMPQTIEAINHAKNAGVPIMVAINKIDKPGANPDRIKEELSHHGLISEDWGGDIIMVPISAKKKVGLDDLLENVLLLAEVAELKANPKRKAYGVVVEAELDKGRGPVMSVLVQNGTLQVGDGILAGKSWGRVRAMTNENGLKMKSAKPSAPVEILGMDSVPDAGDHFYVMEEKKARSIAELRAARAKEEEQRNVQKVTLDNIFDKIKEGEMKDLNIIIKADVQGSVEALIQSFQGIKSEEVRISIVHAAVGAISESDVMLASASNAFIIGFNVRPDANARNVSERESVDIRLYRVIYDAIDDVKSAMAGLLAPTVKEVFLGHAQVRQVIPTPKVIVAGAYVQDGKITSNCELRIVRDGIVIHEGHIASLRRFKDDVKEVTEGFECGIAIDSYRDIKEGDQIEAFIMKEEATELR